MQKKEMTLPASKNEIRFFELLSLTSITSRLELLSIFHRLAAIYSFLLEKEVTPRQAVYYFYAQITLTVVLLPCSIGIGWRLFFLTLFCQALRRT